VCAYHRAPATTPDHLSLYSLSHTCICIPRVLMYSYVCTTQSASRGIRPCMFLCIHMHSYAFIGIDICIHMHSYASIMYIDVFMFVHVCITQSTSCQIRPRHRCRTLQKITGGPNLHPPSFLSNVLLFVSDTSPFF